jgi:hypothetical protein
VLKLYPHQDTEATIYGKVVHKAAEDYIRDGTPLAEGLEQFQRMLDSLRAIPGEKLCELEMALLPDCSPCDFKDDARWVRGIADLVIINGGKAWTVDYKTGNAKYPDVSQLELMSLMVFAHYPDVETIHAALLFTRHNKLVPAMYYRKDEATMWRKWTIDVGAIERSHEVDVWNPNPNGLCRKWCPVTYCEHCG